LKTFTYLAFDFGTQKIGIAIGRQYLRQAQAVEDIRCPRQKPDWGRIDQLLKDWEANALVVGLPISMDGSDNAITKLARRFGDQLRGRYNLPVHMVDERLTSHAARHSLQDAGVSSQRIRRQGVDKYAAREILQTYLNQLDKP